MLIVDVIELTRNVLRIFFMLFNRVLMPLIRQMIFPVTFNTFTSDFTVTVNDINGLLFLFFSMKFMVKQIFE